ncbi:rhodanese-like domain-containing protein [Flavobacterium sp. NG2]|uniref:rhodanese-like domain-containing protein n=1 Tax=Flavobacterium sp. NG2 TaxID=3097547 RepID=UPI002A81CD42|nr:rhodanese-like domain-containing protein [Flavobacterium sp. NG2]WPR71410.1 rhodanese-like domain-containing protein [Flavobacterium sp. NG2]
MRYLIISLLLLLGFVVKSQNSIPEVLEKYNKKTVPYINVGELKSTNCLLLDTREPKEYKISHIPKAIAVGYNQFNLKNLATKIKDKKTPIIVYCSIGVRSEQIGEKLKKAGYTNVYNLYGGIFEYKNKGGKVVNSNNIETDSVHAFNKQWSVYLKKGIKVYED